MKILCTNNKTFELTENSEKLGQIHYDNLFSQKATITAASDVYQVASKGIFSTTIAVTKGMTEVASLQMNWKGHIIISFQGGPEFILKPTGIFASKYVVEDHAQQKIMLLDPDFNWSKFSYNYNVSYDQQPQDILLVLLAAYAANYYISAMSGAM